jgi:dienelactone hydrolase
MHWLDPTHVLLGVLPAGVRPQPFDEMERTSEISNNALNAVKQGRVVTAHVLTSGDSEELRPPGSEVALTVIDTETGSQRVITKIPLTEIRLSQRVVSISPTRQYAAIMATYAPARVPAGRQLPAADPRFQRLGAIEFKEGQTIHWLDDVKPVTFGAVGTATPIRWSPSGSVFAALGILGAQSIEARTFTVSLGDGGIHAPKALARDAKPEGSDRVFVPEDVQWANDSLLVYGYPAARADLLTESVARSVRGLGFDNTVDSTRRDWWIVSNDGSSRNLTREMAQSPRRLLPLRRAGVMLGNAGGKLWTVDLANGKVSPLEVTPNIQATAILSPAMEEAPKTPVDNLLISSATDAGVELYQAKLRDSGIDLHRSVKLPKGASYRDHSEPGGLVLYETPDTKLQALQDGSETPVTLLSLNRQMDSIAKPELRRFDYRSTDGKTLKGGLLMPHGYVSGQRYPLVVMVYGGSVPWTGDWGSPYGNSPYPEPLLFAGRGYAVLVPSVPLQPMGVGSDPMLDLDKGVKPAIEKVVEMGVADPNRVGVIGHSYGGYSVYGLVTQTSRFRAAVAFAGVSDLVSMYGRLDSRYRFSSTVNPLSAPASVESQQLRMGAPPWEDPDRYLRNSPFFHADRVTTPILMIHGDLDSISMTQAEQFFIAMNRLNKRSKLVRYLGEGHGIDSPANVLDFWEQIFSWFDEFLLNPGKAESAKQPGKQ